TNLPEDIYIQVDEKLMTQAILNLLSNAIKFTMDNRTVDVQIGHFKTGFIEFIVKDEGVGISEENKRKLFHFDQKFTQEGTKGEKGSGLGLTLVKQIIEKHGGDIWFYSELNKGSEFHFIIPEASKVILLVEDDSISRALWFKASKRILSDFEIVQAANGYEAMTIINEKTPTLVVTDHNMPLMNGIQLIESMRKREETSRIPVIVVTALLPPDLVAKYEDLQVSGLLEKPLNIEQFSAALLEAVD
ncbi:MAG: ATP-binding protein, partial [Syntrophothermus sp.]